MRHERLDSYLGRHHPLPLLYEVALGTLAVPVLAGPLVSLQPGDHSVVPTPGTLGSPQRVLAVHPEDLRGTVEEGEYWGTLSASPWAQAGPASHWSSGRSVLSLGPGGRRAKGR